MSAGRRRWGGGFSAVASVVLIVLFVILTVVVPLLPGYAPYKQNIANGLAEPLAVIDGHLHLFGTDPLGRDLLSRLALGGQVSLAIGLAAVAFSLTVGVTLGLIAGYFRGPLESLIMGLADLQLSVPRILILIAAAAVWGPSVTKLALLLGLTSWVSYGRVARAMALSLREREFVLAAKTHGASAAWNIRTHLLPNVMPQMLVIGSFEFGQIVVLEASMSYLGLGVQPPLPSLGMMINEGQTYLEINPWTAVLPGIVIFLMVAGAQFVSQRFTSEAGSGLRTARATAG